MEVKMDKKLIFTLIPLMTRKDTSILAKFTLKMCEVKFQRVIFKINIMSRFFFKKNLEQDYLEKNSAHQGYFQNNTWEHFSTTSS